jgi:hypothetical protein
MGTSLSILFTVEEIDPVTNHARRLSSRWSNYEQVEEKNIQLSA